MSVLLVVTEEVLLALFLFRSFTADSGDGGVEAGSGDAGSMIGARVVP